MRMTQMTSTRPRLFPLSVLFFLLGIISVWIGCSPAAPSADVRHVEVPEFLLSRFEAVYPKADSALWEKGDGFYNVTFLYSGSKLAVDFLPDGAVERTKMYIDDTALPAPTLSFLSTTLPGQKINHATKNVDGFGAVTWEVSIGADVYLFSTQGELLGLLPRQPAARQ